ncbi:MAG TPA: nucleotide-binding protein [Puia sp.]
MLQTIIIPYINNNQFIFDGYVINPTQVKRLKVTETEKSVVYYAEQHEQKMARAGIADLGTNRREIPIQGGKDITIEIIDEAKKNFTTQPEKNPIDLNVNPDGKKVFVVHGHDMAALHEICRILVEEFNLEPVVLSEQPNVGLDTIISKFERLANDCFCAIILLTPDDKTDDPQNVRARQNVIFELGYFLGKLRTPDKRKIIILKKNNVEIPSDINGVLYLQFHTNITEVFYQLKKQFDIWK